MDNMLHWAIVAVTVALVAAIVTYLHSQRTRRAVTTIPGLDASDPILGNLADIGKIGSLHEFLINLHERFGDIAKFWWGQQLTVSIASADLFKQHSRVFDRPPEIFKLFEPLITPESIQYANGSDGRERRNVTDSCFSHDAMHIFHDNFQEAARVLVKKLEEASPDEHIPVTQHMFTAAIRAITTTSFGSFFKDNREILKFKSSYDTAWTEMESRLGGNEPGPDRMQRFEEAKKSMYDTIQQAIEMRRATAEMDHDKAVIDTLIASDWPESQILCDALSFFIGGFHTSGLLLSWGLYYLASHPDIQEKVYQELVDVLGQEEIPPGAVAQLVYMQQVLDETLRCSVLAPFAARVEYVDSQLGEYKIPPGTPVIHALGVTLQDERQWPRPKTFDPDRFSPENRKKMPKCCFEPFGFAGKRKCPGYRFSYTEATILFAGILRKFKFKIVPGQTVIPVYGLVTKPKDEIWVTVERR